MSLNPLYFHWSKIILSWPRKFIWTLMKKQNSVVKSQFLHCPKLFGPKYILDLIPIYFRPNPNLFQAKRRTSHMIIEILPKITALAIIAPPKRTMVFRALKTALSCLELGLSVASKRSSSSLSSKILLKVEPPPETRKGKIQLQCN